MKCASRKLQEKWNKHRKRWKKCHRCVLANTATLRVFGRGSLPADILFIGEGPGKTEDVLGKPFLGKSGKVLDSWLRELGGKYSWCLTNLVACRACDQHGAPNRAPTTFEAGQCRDRVRRMQSLVQPRLVVLLGRTASIHYDPENWNTPTLSLYHPSYILRQGGVTSAVNKGTVETLLAGTRTHLESAHVQGHTNPKAVLEYDSKAPYGARRNAYVAKPRPLSRKA
jgi:uracil-DNA glycosylase family 4